MFIAEEEAKLAPLMGYNPFWYWMMLFVLLATVLLTIFVFSKLKSSHVQPRLKHVATNSYVDEMNKVYALVSNRNMTVQEGYQRVSLTIREFLSTKSNLPAHNMTLQELRESGAPTKVLESIETIYPVVFGGKQVTEIEEFNSFMNSSRAILDGWWN